MQDDTVFSGAFPVARNRQSASPEIIWTTPPQIATRDTYPAPLFRSAVFLFRCSPSRNRYPCQLRKSRIRRSPP
jgi:hypothetical protein